MTVIPSDNTSFMVIIQHPYKEEAIASQKEDLIPLLKDLNIIFNNTHDAISLVEYTKYRIKFSKLSIYVPPCNQNPSIV